MPFTRRHEYVKEFKQVRWQGMAVQSRAGPNRLHASRLQRWNPSVDAAWQVRWQSMAVRLGTYGSEAKPIPPQAVRQRWAPQPMPHCLVAHISPTPQAHRRDDDIAIVNAGMRFRLEHAAGEQCQAGPVLRLLPGGWHVA